jgi:transposase-like protein
LRIRRKFTDKFKKAAVKRLAKVSVAEVARACGVSVSVLHRWRRQLGSHRAAGHADVDAKLRGRRIFSREFKESGVRRLESGESVGDAVQTFDISPTVVRRWWHEWRKYGEAAFSGYGKSRSPAPSTRMVIVRFTADEYEGIKTASLERQATSLPDFVRAQLLPARQAPSVAEIADRLAALVAAVHDAVNDSLPAAAREREPLGARVKAVQSFQTS